MKSGRISNNDKYVIQGMYAENKTIEEISKAVDRSVKVVNNYIQQLDKIHNTVAEVQAEAKPEGTADTKKAGYASHTNERTGQVGATIATQMASQLGDESLKKSPKGTNRSFKGNVFKIKEQELM